MKPELRYSPHASPDTHEVRDTNTAARGPAQTAGLRAAINFLIFAVWTLPLEAEESIASWISLLITVIELTQK